MSIDRMGADGGRSRPGPALAVESGPDGVMGVVTAFPGTVADAPGASRAD